MNATRELFRFQSVEMPEDLFHVIRFRGTEGLNTLFEFSIDLVSRKVDVDTAAVLRNRGVFTIHRKDGSSAVFGGYPAGVTQSGHFNGYTYYSVVLRPTFHKLCGVMQSRVFLNKTAQDVVTELLQEQPYFSFPYEFRLSQAGYPAPEFAMQYEESVYDYICWRLEKQGIAWHIEQEGLNDKLVFSDTPRIYSALFGTPPLRYSPPSGMQVDRDEELVAAFNLACHPLPNQVVIRTYNWQAPNKPVVGKAQVSAEGLGDVYMTTEAVNTDAEATRMAAIRAEELLCRGRLFSGISAVPAMRPGYVFTLEGHYNPAFNQEYFLTEVTHEGSQEAFLTLGLGIPLHNAQEHFFYHNNFVCIESGIQYRPVRKAPRAVIHGIVQAFIDGSGSGARPELDDFGRYKVMFPFDVSSRQKGNASCWIRMAQPQVGNKSGMTFPLLPGTEVTVSFQDGNPDLPVITGALSNGETGALTKGVNTNATGMRTAGGNQLVFNDKDAKQGILLGTPSGRGLSMSSGSLDSTTMTTDTWLKAASTMSADISTLGHTLYGGYKNAQIACTHDVGSIMAAASACLAGLADSAFDTAADSASIPELIYGADLAKVVNMAVQAGIAYSGQAQALAQGKASTAYAATTTALKEKTISQIQVTPETSKLVAGIVLSLLGQMAQAGVEFANVGIATEDLKNDSGADAKDTDYLKNKKTAAIHKVLTSTVADLIPEILSTILVFKTLDTGKEHTVKGGVSLHATQHNISLAANGPVAMHTPSGILLNTAYSEVSAGGGGIKTTNLSLTTPAASTFFAAEPASNWGTGEGAGSAKETLNEHLATHEELGFTGTPQLSYLATFTGLAFEQSKYHKTMIDETVSQQAKTHYLLTRGGESSISMRTEEIKNIPPGISLTTKLENANDENTIVQSLQVKKGETDRSITLSKDGILLNAETKGKTSNILCKDGEITLVTKDGKEAILTLGKEGITLTLAGKGIMLTEKSVQIDLEEVQASGILIKNNKINSTTGSKIIVGGELEVMGTVSGITLSGLSQQVSDLKENVQESKEAADAGITGLTKQLEEIRSNNP